LFPAFRSSESCVPKFFDRRRLYAKAPDWEGHGELSGEEIGGALNEMRKAGPEGAGSASRPNPALPAKGPPNHLAVAVPGAVRDKGDGWMKAA